MLYFFVFLATQYKHHSLFFCECGLDGFDVEGQFNIENLAEDSGLARGRVEDFAEVLWLGFWHSGH